jgi:Bacteriophage probable baseplate hub protein
MAGTSTGLATARPMFTVGGEDKAFLAAALLGLVVHETVAGLFRCEAAFGNWGNKNGQPDFLYFDRDVLEFGKDFAIKVGDVTIFDGRITALEAHFPEGRPAEIAVLAEDRFQDLRMTRRSRTFADMSDADVMRRIAQDHGLSPQINVTGPTHKVLAQVNQSDLAFLRERARAVGAELWMDRQTLHVETRAARSGSAKRLAFGRELREFSALADLAGQRTSITVGGWDVSGKSALSAEATDSVISGELGGDESGVSILKNKLGDRKDAIAHGVPINQQEAQARAEAYFRGIARRFVTAQGVAEPDPPLRVGASAELSGLGPLFSGKYYVAGVRHIFDGAKGLRTEFTAERPGLSRP